MLYYIVFIYIVLYCRFCFICVFTFYFMCEWQKYVPNSRKHGPRIPLFLTRRGFAIPAGIFPQKRHLPFFTPPPEQNAKAHQHGLRRHRLYECQRSPMSVYDTALLLLRRIFRTTHDKSIATAGAGRIRLFIIARCRPAPQCCSVPVQVEWKYAWKFVPKRSLYVHTRAALMDQLKKGGGL